MNFVDQLNRHPVVFGIMILGSLASIVGLAVSLHEGSGTAKEDPRGPSLGKQGSYRILRGGSWYDGLIECRSSSRWSQTPSFRSGGYAGMRVVLDTGTGPEEWEYP